MCWRILWEVLLQPYRFLLQSWLWLWGWPWGFVVLQGSKVRAGSKRLMHELFTSPLIKLAIPLSGLLPNLSIMQSLGSFALHQEMSPGLNLADGAAHWSMKIPSKIATKRQSSSQAGSLGWVILPSGLSFSGSSQLLVFSRVVVRESFSWDEEYTRNPLTL